MAQLERLNLGWCKRIADEDAQALGCLSSLMELQLARTQVRCCL